MLSLDHIERPLIMTVRPAAIRCMFCWTPVRTSVGGGSDTAKQLSPVPDHSQFLAYPWNSCRKPTLAPQGYGFEFNNVRFQG